MGAGREQSQLCIQCQAGHWGFLGLLEPRLPFQEMGRAVLPRDQSWQVERRTRGSFSYLARGPRPLLPLESGEAGGGGEGRREGGDGGAGQCDWAGSTPGRCAPSTGCAHSLRSEWENQSRSRLLCVGGGGLPVSPPSVSGERGRQQRAQLESCVPRESRLLWALFLHLKSQYFVPEGLRGACVRGP